MQRVLLTTAAVASVLAVLTYPLPVRVRAVATLTPQHTERVYATVAGFVEQSVQTGERVQSGQLIMKLRNPAVELDYQSARARLNNQATLVEALECAELMDQSGSERLPAARAKLKHLVDQYEIHASRMAALEIRASQPGLVLPGVRKSASQDDEVQLSEWIDLATEEKNLGCFVTSGTEICRIAPDDAFEAEAIVPQSVANRIQPQAEVKLTLAALPSDDYQGTVVEISRRRMSEQMGDVDSTEATSALASATTALEVSYLVRVELQDSSPLMVSGQQAKVLVSSAPLSVARRVYLTFAGLLRMR